MKELFSFSKLAYHLVGFRLIVLIGLMAISAGFEGLGISLFLPLLMGADSDNVLNNAITSLFEQTGIPYVFENILICLVLFFFLRSAFLVIQESRVGKIIAHILVRLRCNLAKRVFQADYQYLINQEQGYINNAILREFDLLSLAFKTYSNILVSFAFVIVYALLPFLLNAKLSLILFAFAFPAFLIIRKINRLTREYSVQQSTINAKFQGLLIQALNYLKYLKATASAPMVLNQIETESKSLGHIQYRTYVLQGITKYGFEPLAILTLAGLLYYQVEILGREILEVAFLLFLLRRAMTSLLGVQQSIRKFYSSVGSIQVFKRLDHELHTHHESLPSNPRSPDFNQSIRFESVSFAYRGQKPILNDLSFEIRPKSTIAFVGNSGAGKSTLVNLLTGLLSPTEGNIFLGQHNFFQIHPIELKKQIGYITQESVIFNDTIKNNIVLWDDTISEERILQAAKQAHIHDFIQELPQGYDTRLGDGGLNISGGQRQRIMIARELCKQTELLIFDEATSALDTHSEREIQKNIDEFRGKKTVVIIAHRLSTVRNCDCIFVIENGHIVEHGSFQELYASDGKFKNMVDEQSTQRQYSEPTPIDQP